MTAPVGNNGQVAASTPFGWTSVDFNLPANARPTGVALRCSGWIVGELDKGESGPFPGAVHLLRVIHAGLPLGWRARCTILELESSNGQRTNRAEEL